MYRIVSNKMIQRLSDSAFIPVDPNSNAYKAYLRWVDEGNVAPIWDKEARKQEAINAVKPDVQEEPKTE